MEQDLGHLLGIAVRPAGAAPQRVRQAEAFAGHGLEGDRHADPVSPRQLLLAGALAYADLDLPALALRENLLLEADTASFRSGDVLRIGATFTLRLMFQCEACGSLDRHQPGLSRAIGGRRGMLARVLAGGRIQAGDRVTGLGPLLPAWPEDWRERVRMVLDALPPGHVLEYRQLAHLAGVAAGYCRAFPRAIARLGPDYAGKAVPASAPSGLPRWRGDGLFADEVRAGFRDAAGT
ncbi:MOSC domain-containing protein [Massilia sp. ST3]|uniref:MOSC domain-containing protein n=1 Tax=Massilia sp. ST3 TaxID=2824903 RepID=UPI001B82B1BB|nr:MOSC domain-containing protein [Massilia sp. ST3]MBQ5946720.1 MOSC domain-containing protein [Massilia sp. ST3]